MVFFTLYQTIASFSDPEEQIFFQNIMARGENACHHHFWKQTFIIWLAYKLMCTFFFKFETSKTWLLGEEFTFPKQALVFMCLQCKSFENTVGKRQHVTSNFSISHSVFYSFGELSAIFITFENVVCKLFEFTQYNKSSNFTTFSYIAPKRWAQIV